MGPCQTQERKCGSSARAGFGAGMSIDVRS
jgi:hypothetical protein